MSTLDAILPDLQHVLSRRWLLLGTGNDLRGDDAFGPLLARRLRALGLPAIDGGTAPENYTGPILRAQPEVLIVADAADFGAVPGTLGLLRAQALSPGGSTHDPGLKLLLDYLRSQAPLDDQVLALQPGRLELGSSPSAVTLRTIAELIAVFAPRRAYFTTIRGRSRARSASQASRAS